MVLSSGSCADVAAHGMLMTDLGPSDNAYATSATIELTFSAIEEYTVCYKLAAGNYVDVGSIEAHASIRL